MFWLLILALCGSLKNWFQVAVAFDQLLNALFGGYADETISSRAYRQRERMPFKIYRACVDRLFFWQADHCRQAYESELSRRQLPPEMRNP